MNLFELGTFSALYVRYRYSILVQQVMSNYQDMFGSDFCNTNSRSCFPQHMKNYQELLRRVTTWLRPEGLCFIHIFTHLYFAYHFEVRGIPASSRLDASVSLQFQEPFPKTETFLAPRIRDAPSSMLRL